MDDEAEDGKVILLLEVLENLRELLEPSVSDEILPPFSLELVVLDFFIVLGGIAHKVFDDLEYIVQFIGGLFRKHLIPVIFSKSYSKNIITL